MSGHPLTCPHCDGRSVLDRKIRDGYESRQSDPDAYAYFYRCTSCAATGGWAKSPSGALRLWEMRVVPLELHQADMLKFHLQIRGLPPSWVGPLDAWGWVILDCDDESVVGYDHDVEEPPVDGGQYVARWDSDELTDRDRARALAIGCGEYCHAG